VFRPRLVPGAVPCPRAIAYQRISARREGPIGMGLVIGTLVVGVAAGLVLGGRVGNLGDLRIRWLPLALAGFALQSISISDSVWPLVILAVSYVLLTAFAVENVRARTPGARLILIGILLNFTVIALNGGMPVTRSALVASGEQDTLHELVDGHAVKHHLASADDSLVILGDVIPLAPVHQIVSIGDVFTYLGVAWLVAAGMLRRRDPVTTAAPPPGSSSEPSSGPPEGLGHVA